MNQPIIPKGTLAPNGGNMNTNQLLSSSIYTRSLSNACGRIGPAGPPGGSGPKGDIGANGDKGDIGDKGQKGIIGDKGPRGNIGVDGIQGIKGSTGDRGDKGIQGDKGNKGEVGFKGEIGIGDKGDKGERGPPGEVAAAGLNEVLLKDNISTQRGIVVPSVNTNSIIPYSGNVIALMNPLFTMTAESSDITLNTNSQGMYINEVQLNDGITANMMYINNGATIAGGILYANRGISTIGITCLKLQANELITAAAGISTSTIDSNSSLSLGTVSATSVVISRTSIPTTIASTLTCNSSLTSSSFANSNNTASITSTGVGTFSALVSNTNISAPLLTSTSYTIDNIGATFQKISTPQISGTNYNISSGIGTFNGITVNGRGTFTGISISEGLTVNNITSSLFNVASNGIATFNGVTCGTVKITSSSITSTSFQMSNDYGASFSSVNVSSALTLNSANSGMIIKRGGTSSFGAFSYINGTTISSATTSSSSAYDLSTIVYDSILTLPSGSPTSFFILPLTSIASSYSPLRFYLHNNSTQILKLNVYDLQLAIWGPATGGNGVVGTLDIPSLKTVSVTVMSTPINYLSTTSSSQNHYFVKFENSTDAINSFGSTVTIGKLGSTITILGNTFNSRGITCSGTGVSVGSDTELTQVTIGRVGATTTIAGTSFNSRGITCSGTGVSVGSDSALTQVTIGRVGATTTIAGTSFTSRGITYSGTGVSVGSDSALTQVTIGHASSTTTIVGSINDSLNRYINPVGTIIMYGGKGTASPSGYLWCDGAQLATTGTYGALYGVIAFTYGGSGLLFNVPNLQSRFPIGSASASTMGVNGVVSGGSFSIGITNLPAHRHTTKVGISTNTVTCESGSGTSRLTSATISKTDNTQDIESYDTGSGSLYYQPYTVVNYIIKY